MAFLKTRGLMMEYDKIADILYVSFGRPKRGVDEEVAKGIFVRLNPRTKSPLGFLVMDFEKRFSAKRTPLLPLWIRDVAFAR